LKIRIATYNCKNYFLSPESNAVKPARERKALARVIDTVDADILCLQEVENGSVLEEINQNLSRPYNYCLVESGNSNRGINIGMMSRLIFDGQSHKETHLKSKNGQPLYGYQTENCRKTESLSAMGFQRDLFLAEFNINGKTLLLFNTHLKSRRNYKWFQYDADTIRWSEASMAREILSQYISNPDYLVLLAGDLNQRHRGESIKPITDWAELRDPIFEDIQYNDPSATTFHPKPKERIDYLLPAINLYHHYIPGSAKIHKSTMAKKASDHFPVSIDFEF
jgi:endonuclease/exonuclease/phosphatase family metal-dependent hydrolase